jgi:hypothetical protein
MAHMGLSAAEIKDMNADDLETALANQIATQKTTKSMADMKDRIMKNLLPLAESFMGVFVMLTPVLEGIGYIIAAFVKPFSDLHKLITGTGEELSVLEKVTAAIALVAGGWLVVQQGINAATAVGNALKKKGLTTDLRGVAAGLGKAVVGIWSSLMALPFGLGIPIAIGAAAGLISLIGGLITQSGDVGIDPNGGPVVSSPKEGGIFQGTKNDGVSMSPGHGTSGGPSTSTGIDMSGVEKALTQIKDILNGIQNKDVQIVVGDKVVDAIRVEGNINSSYRIGTGGAIIE